MELYISFGWAMIAALCVAGNMIVILYVRRRHRHLQYVLEHNIAHELRRLHHSVWHVPTLLRTLNPSSQLPQPGGWAASIDFILELIRLLEAKRPSLVVELGTGLSTVVIALKLEQMACGRLVSVASATRRSLKMHGVEHIVDLRVAHLCRNSFSWWKVPWYNCDILDDLDHIDILVVDGPPLPIHPEVRYPALPFFKERLRGDFAVLLDDADRPGELAVLERWSAEFPDLQFHRLPLEKGAAVIVPKQCHLWCSIVLRWMCVVPTHSTLRLCDSNKARMPNVRQINDHPYLYDAGLPMAVLKVRDEITRLPHCLVHHRAMGVSLFAIVDDGSRDGTLEYLLDQPDVVLFQASGEFGSSWISWISTLLGLFGVGRWVLIVDADEALVLPTSGPDALQVFLGHVEKEGADAVIANMVDMYSDRPISETVADSDQLLTEICPYFDPGPYLDWANPSPRPPVLYAGVRERIFWPNWRRNQVGWRRTVGSCRHKLGRIPLLAHWRDPTHPSNVGPPCIFACPLVRWTPDKVFVSRHVIEGVRVSAHLLPLLHFKFLADFYEKVADAVANRQYFRQSSEYRLYQNVLNKHRNLSLFDSASIRYKGTGSLISAGVMVVPSVTRDIRSGCRGPVPLTRPDARGGPLVEA